MNIEETKAISLVHILEKIGHTPTKQTATQAWYLSPLHNEKTASFKVHIPKNLWYDFGEGIGGSVVGFVRHYLQRCGEDHTVSDVLRWLKNMSGQTLVYAPVTTVEEHTDTSKITIKTIRSIQRMALIHYLEQRGISLKVAKRHMKELWLHNKETDKAFYALGFYNEENGFEIRNPFFKGSLGKKDVTLIRGSTGGFNSIYIFEGFMDFLSILEQRNGEPFTEDVIVMNSLSMINTTISFIQGFSYRSVHTWLDNDEAGTKALNAFRGFFKTEENIRHIPMNDTYAGHKDVNAWHVHKLGL